MWKDPFFAIVADETVPFDPVAHKRRDLAIRAWHRSEKESSGQATLTLTVATALTGLGAVGVGTCGLLSRELEDGSLKLIARGHLTTVPTRGMGEPGDVEVVFQCSPVNWDAAEAAAVASYNVLPMTDPVLIPKAQRTSAKEVLDGHFRTVHCHPATHEFTCPEKFGRDLPVLECPYPFADTGIKTRVVNAIVAAVVLTMTCEFVQSGDGLLDLTNALLNSTAYGMVDTLSPDQVEKAWPKAGSKLNGDSGYTIVASSLTRLNSDQVAARDIVNPAPTQAGPFRGPPEKTKTATFFSYVADRSMTVPVTEVLQDGRQVTRWNYAGATSGDPAGLNAAAILFDRAYYDASLKLAWSVRQKRKETIQCVFRNGAQGVTPGEVRYLNLRCEDVTDNSSTLPWAPGQNYVVGDTRRVGAYEVECTVPHLSAATWADDEQITLPNGTKQDAWVVLPGNDAPLADRSQNSYWRTVRGEQTWQGGVCKVRRIFADGDRGTEIRFQHPLTDDLLDLTTACSVTLTAPVESLGNGGSVTAKVTGVEMYSGQDTGDYVEVTLMAATGTGLPFVTAPTDGNGNPVDIGSQPGTVNVSGEPWDVIQYQSFADYAPYAFPAIQGFIGVVNDADHQAAFISANDFLRGDATRGGDKTNDPNNLIKSVPTGITIRCTQIAGLPTFEATFYPACMGVWQGPKQYDTGLGA